MSPERRTPGGGIPQQAERSERRVEREATWAHHTGR